jgi:hypothetical protein
MLVLLGAALFCLLTTLGSLDEYLLAADLGFIVAPLFLIVLVIYSHVCYGHWLACERERQYINQRVIPPFESIPTLFSLPDAIPPVLTGFILYWLVPLVLVTITFKVWAFPDIGILLTYITGVVTYGLVLLQSRRRPDNHRQGWSLLYYIILPLIHYTILLLILAPMFLVTVTPQSFQRPLNLVHAELPKAWLVRRNMRRASAGSANLQEANLQEANLQEANLSGASLIGANLQRATLQGATLQGATLAKANLQRANLRRADLRRADLQWANLREATLPEANLTGADLRDTQNLAQEQINMACVDEATILPQGLTKPAPCPTPKHNSDEIYRR